MDFCRNFPDVYDKNFLVTGASSGVGKNVALILDSLGAKLVLNGRNEEKLQETYELLQNKSRHAIIPADLTAINHDDFIKECQKEVPLAGIAHCAGEYVFLPLRAYDSEIFLKAFQDYVLPMGELFISAVRNKKNEDLSLVVMSTICSRFAVKGNAIYGACRAATESLCRNIAIEFAQRNVRCNYVVAGHMAQSKMSDEYFSLLQKSKSQEDIEKIFQYPLGFGNTKDAANAMVFLLSSASSWMTGQEIVVDGGYFVKGN